MPSQRMSSSKRNTSASMILSSSFLMNSSAQTMPFLEYPAASGKAAFMSSGLSTTVMPCEDEHSMGFIMTGKSMPSHFEASSSALSATALAGQNTPAFFCSSRNPSLDMKLSMHSGEFPASPSASVISAAGIIAGSQSPTAPSICSFRAIRRSSSVSLQSAT